MASTMVEIVNLCVNLKIMQFDMNYYACILFHLNLSSAPINYTGSWTTAPFRFKLIKKSHQKRSGFDCSGSEHFV